MARRRTKTQEKTLDQITDNQRRIAGEQNKQRELELANYALALQDKKTRELVWEILSSTGLYDVNAYCDATVFFSEGRRAIGQEIILLLNEIDVMLYPKMIMENAGRQEETNDE